MLAGRSGGALERASAGVPAVAWAVFQPRVLSPPARHFAKTVGAILYEHLGMGYFQLIGEAEDLREWTYAPVGDGSVGWTDSV